MSLTTFYYDDPAALFSEMVDAAFDARSTSSSNNTTRDVQAREPSGPIRPRMDLHEAKDKNEMEAQVELPGLTKANVEIDVNNNRLTISGKSSVAHEREKDGYAVRERRCGKFSRTIPLPTGVKAEDVKAHMEDGLLTVKFPKVHPDQERKKVSIS